jgi:hypothetical protein
MVASPRHARPGARLVVREGEGHFGIYEHLGALTEPGG